MSASVSRSLRMNRAMTVFFLPEARVFHGDSYGYRPGRSPVDAVRVCRERCWRRDWAVDLDVKAFGAPHLSD
jgi:hypothetical protein